MFLLILSLIAVSLLIFGMWAEPSITFKPFKIDMSGLQILKGIGGFMFIVGLVIINITTKQIAYDKGATDMREESFKLCKKQVSKVYEEGLRKGAEIATDDIVTKLKNASDDKSADDLIDWE